MEVVITTDPKVEDIQEIKDGLSRHNSPHLKGIFHTDVACYSYTEEGGKSGGIVGEIWGNWLMVKFLWVHENHEGWGIGSKLLSQLEGFAVKQGCHSSLLDTFSFQAEPFYEKHGYICEMTLKNHPVSTERYYMTKKLQ